MRILHAYKVAFTELYGGIPEAIRTLSIARRSGISSSILAARVHGFGRSLTAEQVSICLTGSFGDLLSMPAAPTYPIKLASLAQTADVVALHLPFPLNNLGIWLGIPPTTALVVHWHSEIVGRRLLSNLIAPLVHNTLARADRIIVSDEKNLDASPMLGLYRSKCSVVPFGTDTGFWGALDSVERAESERLAAAHPRLVLATGRLVPYKGFEVLIESLRRTDATAIIVGAGPENRRLRRCVDSYGLTDRVVLAGNVSRKRLRILLHAARVFVLPSVTTAETFGICQIEAMSVGLPVVNTDLASGVPNVARHGIEALTVPLGDPARLSDAICKLLDDRELAARLGAAGRRRAATEFDHDLFVDRVHAVYAECMIARACHA